MAGPSIPRRTTAWRSGAWRDETRSVPEERAIALTYDGTTYAVMMATPADLNDFGIGFTRTEGLVGAPSEIEEISVVDTTEGIELRMRLAQPAASALAARRRRLAGPVGCGLCGIESLQEAVRPVPSVDRTFTVSAEAVRRAVRDLPRHQVVNRATHAVHAAAYCDLAGRVVLVREDIGRHNALDKAVGAVLRTKATPETGFLLVTSRLSVELIQKATVTGFPALVGISAPTAMAIEAAEQAGMILIGIARDDGFEVFTGADRVADTEAAGHVA